MLNKNEKNQKQLKQQACTRESEWEYQQKILVNLNVISKKNTQKCVKRIKSEKKKRRPLEAKTILQLFLKMTS